MPKKASAKPNVKASKAAVKPPKATEKKTAKVIAKPNGKNAVPKVKSVPAVAIPQQAPVAVAPAKKTRIPIPPGLTGEAQKLALKWRQLFEKSQEQEPHPYKMSGHYEAKTPIKHKVLGWGYVLSSNNSRIEVLFQDGIKTLITDLKE